VVPDISKREYSFYYHATENEANSPFNWQEFQKIMKKGTTFIQKSIEMGFKASVFDFEAVYNPETEDIYCFELNSRSGLVLNIWSEFAGKGKCNFKNGLDLVTKDNAEINCIPADFDH
jgi:hypothetical protein